MFGALNRFIGRLEGEPVQQASNNGDNSFGFQVLRNKDPDLPLEPWFDFIIGINGRLIVSNTLYMSLFYLMRFRRMIPTQTSSLRRSATALAQACLSGYGAQRSVCIT